MNRVKKVVFEVTAVLMVLFFLLSSTDLIIKEEKEEIKKVSVLVTESENTYLDNFKKGIQEEAGTNRVDVACRVIQETDEEMHVLEYLRREYGDGAQAVILTGSLSEAVRVFCEAKREKCLWVEVNSFEEESGCACAVSFDLEDAARQLAGEIQKRHGKNAKVVFLTCAQQISWEVYGTAEKIFQEEGIETDMRRADDAAAVREAEVIYVGCWMPATEQAARYIGKNPVYGIGYSDEILKRIREGAVDGVMAFSMYAEGLYAMQQAIAAIEQGRCEERMEVPCKWISMENIDEEQEFLSPVY